MYIFWPYSGISGKKSPRYFSRNATSKLSFVLCIFLVIHQQEINIFFVKATIFQWVFYLHCLLPEKEYAHILHFIFFYILVGPFFFTEVERPTFFYSWNGKSANFLVVPGSKLQIRKFFWLICRLQMRKFYKIPHNSFSKHT